MKPFSCFQKIAQTSRNCIKFPKERIKTSVAIEMLKTENHCKTPKVVDATDGTRHTRKRGLRTLKRTLSARILKRTLKGTLLLSTLKMTLSLRAIKRTLSLRTLKGPSQKLTTPCRLQWKRQGTIGSMGRGKSRFRVECFEGGPQICISWKTNI